MHCGCVGLLSGVGIGGYGGAIASCHTTLVVACTRGLVPRLQPGQVITQLAAVCVLICSKRMLQHDRVPGGADRVGASAQRSLPLTGTWQADGSMQDQQANMAVISALSGCSEDVVSRLAASVPVLSCGTASAPTCNAGVWCVSRSLVESIVGFTAEALPDTWVM